MEIGLLAGLADDRAGVRAGSATEAARRQVSRALALLGNTRCTQGSSKFK